MSLGKKEILNSDTDIEKDLGVSGDDAIDFILTFCKKYNVDRSNFKFENHFEDEGTGWLQPDYNFNKKPLTMGHLEKAIISGKLDDSILEE